MATGVIEILVFLGFVLPICWWQFRDLEKAKEETARKRAEEAKRKAELEAQDASSSSSTESSP